jgi:hypothetical protein
MGGGLSLFLCFTDLVADTDQFDKVQNVCILTNACVEKSTGEMSLYMYSLWIASATSLRKIYILMITGVFQFHVGKNAKKY